MWILGLIGIAAPIGYEIFLIEWGKGIPSKFLLSFVIKNIKISAPSFPRLSQFRKVVQSTRRTNREKKANKNKALPASNTPHLFIQFNTQLSFHKPNSICIFVIDGEKKRKEPAIQRVSYRVMRNSLAFL